MPLLWRYLLKNYFKVFSLCIGALIVALLATRFGLIAELSTFSPKPHLIALFTLCQIPYILPIAIPIAGFISAILVFEQLSASHELTALRTAGLSLNKLHAPLSLAALFLSLITFLITSELTPRCRLYSHKLINRAITHNPLLLIQKPKLLNLGASYVEMKMTCTGQCAENFIFAIKDHSKDYLRLITAKQFTIKEEQLIGEKVTLISHLPSQELNQFDHLLIENQQEVTTKTAKLSELIQKKRRKIDAAHLSLTPLLYALGVALPKKTKPFYHARFELHRRFYFTIMTFALTFLGLSLGIQVGRQKRQITLFFAIAIPALALISSVIAKSLYASPLLSTLCYLIPLVLTLALALRNLHRSQRGIE